MRAFVDLKGKMFGRLTPLRRIESKNGEAMWQCRCDCGSNTVVSRGHLQTGHTKSCGCLKHEARLHGCARRGSKRHGTYLSWDSAIARCTRTSSPSFKNYGAKGVRVARRWRGQHGFLNFLTDLGPRPAGTSLGRFGDRGNYTASNCEWQSPSAQVRNRRRRKVEKRNRN